MLLLIAGLAFFVTIHLVPTSPDLRRTLTARLGENGYKGLFSLVSLAGLALIVIGFDRTQDLLGSENPILWDPPVWTRHIAFLLMIPALILLVAAYVPSRIRTAAKHPMLAAVKLWALSHLLANGDLASMLMFGTFLGWAVYDRISVKKRGAAGPLGTAKGGLGGDLVAVGAGLGAWAFLMFGGHYLLFGMPLISVGFAP